MKIYQMKPITSNITYALRTTENSALKGTDLIFKGLRYSPQSAGSPWPVPWYNDCYGYTCDYYNLMLAPSSPTKYELIDARGGIEGLISPPAYVFANENLHTYLQSHGVQGLQNVRSSASDAGKLGEGQFIVGKQFTWDPAGLNYDADFTWLNISQDLKPTLTAGKAIQLDADSFHDKSAAKDEVMVMYSGQPVVSFYIPTSNDADIIATTTTDTSTQLSERSVFTGGTTVLLKIRPHDGKYIKSLVMNDKHKQDENPGVDSKEYKLADIYSDDMYSFQAELEQGEKVCDSKYDNDAGNLVFTNDSGVDKKYYYSNEPVQVSVIPYDGYMSDGVEITAANDLRSIETTVLDNGSMGYKFSMPDENVTITPYYRLIDDDEHLAELSFNKGGSVSFTDCNTVSNAYINKML
ncbi:MAG: hypothetical protein IIT48_02070 [Lachnospiraceae bacterium]|nr:hypothetical protein [Lachnospiraceae bacterium]